MTFLKQITAITEENFAKVMDSVALFEDNPIFAIGVSGGADSMALCLLADRYAKSLGGRVVALTVEHGLRKESAKEAKMVANWLSEREIEHHILEWEGEKPLTRIEETAREARYDLLLNWCKENSVLHLLLAHNLNDQAETFMLRLAKESGVDGLSGMARRSFRKEVQIIRPLLDFSRAEIIATNHNFGQEWVEDPSNLSDDYARVKWRKFMPSLYHLGLDEKTIAKTAEKQANVRLFMEKEMANFMAENVEISVMGYAKLNYDAFVSLQEQLAFKVLQKVLFCLGNNLYLPRTDAVKRLLIKLNNKQEKNGITIAGSKIMLKKKNVILITREESALPKNSLVNSKKVLWDRFTLLFSGNLVKDAYISSLGKGNVLKIKTDYPITLVTLPAVFDNDGLLLVPHLGYKREGCSMDCKVYFTPRNSLSGVGFFK